MSFKFTQAFLRVTAVEPYNFIISSYGKDRILGMGKRNASVINFMCFKLLNFPAPFFFVLTVINLSEEILFSVVIVPMIEAVSSL